MPRAIPVPERQTRIIAQPAMVAAMLAVVGVLSLFATAHAETAAPAAVAAPNVIATSCGGLTADAAKLFDKPGPVVLRGNFSPGDHVRLAIDLRGAGYAWEVTGTLGTEAMVTPSFWYKWFRTTKWTNHVLTTWSPEQKLLSTAYQGETDGYARWDLDVEVTAAGEGALTIQPTGTGPTPLRVATARCMPRKAAPVTAG